MYLRASIIQKKFTRQLLWVGRGPSLRPNPDCCHREKEEFPIKTPANHLVRRREQPPHQFPLFIDPLKEERWWKLVIHFDRLDWHKRRMVCNEYPPQIASVPI
ncbi:hypothetical protein JTE90_029584 [Oedothorax gibbosus]|uniref:Uncharacterized protein n=1 Tax=Oedothorax gibbosus TaxID=931172 RepID=A0AAV6VBJ4_9ARAC|nr:hypothetical protein JTE90_029584 [Oedothorax gibbosus]